MISQNVAAACARIGLKVIHTDWLPFYGSSWAALSLDDFSSQDLLNNTTFKVRHTCPIEPVPPEFATLVVSSSCSLCIQTTPPYLNTRGLEYKTSRSGTVVSAPSACLSVRQFVPLLMLFYFTATLTVVVVLSQARMSQGAVPYWWI